MLSQEFEQRCRRIVADLKLGGTDDVIGVRALEGGVASDIAVVELRNVTVCIKCALPRLKVAARWEAPVHRNEAEYRWLAFVSSIAPRAAPKLHGRSAAHGGFAMEYLDPRESYLWKRVLLDGRVPQDEAGAVARVLVAIHAASTGTGFDPARFANRDDFLKLRLEPYLIHAAGRHPRLEPRLQALSDALYACETALVHGDVSPKNIVFRDTGPVLLDAECATMGDPCFDVAFCLNHLILKSVHLPAMAGAYLGEAEAFWRAYRAGVTWEAPDRLEARVAALLPALMLARVDGKSPVEYLGETERETVRRLAVPLIEKPQAELAAILSAVLREVGR